MWLVKKTFLQKTIPALKKPHKGPLCCLDEEGMSDHGLSQKPPQKTCGTVALKNQTAINKERLAITAKDKAPGSNRTEAYLSGTLE